MKKQHLIKTLFATALILALSSCVTKKKKKCDTCPSWGSIEMEK